MKINKFINKAIIEDFMDSFKSDIDRINYSENYILDTLYNNIKYQPFSNSCTDDFACAYAGIQTGVIVVATIVYGGRPISETEKDEFDWKLNNLEGICELLNISTDGVLDSKLKKYAIAVENRKTVSELVWELDSNNRYTTYYNMNEFMSFSEHLSSQITSLYYINPIDELNGIQIKYMQIPIDKFMFKGFKIEELDEILHTVREIYMDTFLIGVLLETGRESLLETKEYNENTYYRLKYKLERKEILLEFISTYKVLKKLQEGIYD